MWMNILSHSIIEVVRNLFRLENEIDNTATKDMRNIFSLKKENEAIKDRIIKYIRILSKHEEVDYYKTVREGNFYQNNYI